MVITRHFLQYRLVAVFGSVYFVTLVIATALFIRMVTMKFYHPIFWGWCLWTFVTAYCFFLFMRSVLSPAVQIYPDVIILNYPRRREIPKSSLNSLDINDERVEVSFVEHNKSQRLCIPIRKIYEVD